MLIWFVIIYWVISVGIGLWAALRVRNTADFAVAGRGLPFYVVTATVFATWFGSETVLGIPSVFLKDGLHGVVADPFGSSLCLILVGLFFARPLYRMNLLTIGDFYRNRFGRLAEVLTTLCIVVSYLGWVAAQIKALGLVFFTVSDGALSQETGMMIGAASVLIYTLFGGMWSVAVTTFVQMIVIVLGLLYIAWLVSDMAGGTSTVINHAAANNKFEFLPRFSLTEVVAFTAALITMGFGSIPQQDVFQRMNASKNEHTAVWGSVLGGSAYFLFAFVPLFLVYAATLIDPKMVADLIESDSQRILPSLILNHMPLPAQIIFFGALLSVIMSTASGTLLAPSVTISENVLKGLIGRMSDHSFLWLNRAVVTVFAILVTVYAIYSDESIHGMVENAYKVTLVAAFVPLAAGLYWKRATTQGAACAIVGGLASWIALELVGSEDLWPPQFIGFLVSVAGMLAGSLLPQRYGAPSRQHYPDAAN